MNVLSENRYEKHIDLMSKLLSVLFLVFCVSSMLDAATTFVGLTFFESIQESNQLVAFIIEPYPVLAFPIMVGWLLFFFFLIWGVAWIITRFVENAKIILLHSLCAFFTLAFFVANSFVAVGNNFYVITRMLLW